MKTLKTFRGGHGVRGAARAAFTLIELLVVIAIIAILAIVVILTLNPAQLIQQARDSNRISDFATIKSAIGYYMQDVSNPATGIGAGGGSLWASPTCFEDGPGKIGTPSTIVTPTCGWFNASATISTFISTTTRVSNSTSSWIPINLSLIAVGSPIGQWPVDPVNLAGANGMFVTSTDHFYSFYGTSSTANFFYKIAVHMESTKYSQGGPSDVETNDGGTAPFVYEQGSNPSL